MITLRYHIVTIVVVFLSLGLGILLGAGMGQNWLNDQERGLLERLESRYEEAVKSNKLLQKQLQELTAKIESINQDFINVAMNNYSPELEKQSIFLWNGGLDDRKIREILTGVGMNIMDLQPDLETASFFPQQQQSDQEKEKHPILFLGPQLPEWAEKFADSTVWLQVSEIPQSPSDKWKLLHDISLLVKEADNEHADSQQSELHRSGIQ